MFGKFSASAAHAATRYDFRCPPSSLSRTIFAVFKLITGGSSNLRPADRRCPAPVGKALPKPPPLSHRLLTGGSSFFETRNSRIFLDNSEGVGQWDAASGLESERIA
jgi:hypothetical protein